MASNQDDDAMSFATLLKSKDKVEAMRWLTGAPSGVHRNIGEMSNADSIRYVRSLYDLGARKVVAVHIGINRNYESTDTLVVTLPDHAAARKAIFDSESQRAEEMGYEEEADVGQKYLLSWFD